MITPEHDYAFWCRIPSRANFGDALTPWLMQKITGRYPKFRPASDPRHKFLVTGSIIQYASAPCTVWGSGIMNVHDRPTSPDITVTAVRGPLTHNNLLEAGIQVQPVYGDPALLLPYFYQPPVNKTHTVGLALHFADAPRLLATRDFDKSIKIIDMQQPIETVIDDIVSCDCIASSSLHGIIASHAFGIAASWIEFQPLPSGDGSKFRDYLSSIGHNTDQPHRLSPEQIKPETLSAQLIPPPTNFDSQALLQACPFL